MQNNASKHIRLILGYDIPVSTVGELLGVSRLTLYNWFKKDLQKLDNELEILSIKLDEIKK